MIQRSSDLLSVMFCRECRKIGNADIGHLLHAVHYHDNDDRTFHRANYVVMLPHIDTKLVSLPRERGDHTDWYFAEAGMQSGMGAR